MYDGKAVVIMGNKIRFSDCTVKIIGGVKYTVRSSFAPDGEGKDFRKLYENIVAGKILQKIEQLKNRPCYAGYVVQTALWHENIVSTKMKNMPIIIWNKTIQNTAWYSLHTIFCGGPDRPRVQWRR